VKQILCLLILGLPSSALTLVQNGRSAYSICLAPEASPSEQRGANELQRFVEEMSGARLSITTECRISRPLIFVGDSPALRRVAKGFDAASYGPEEFQLKTAGRHIVIAGGRQRGSMYGVYTFLERLGCRWFTSEISRIPKRSTIEVPALDERQKPAFEYREVYIREAFDKDWAARNKTNGNFAALDASTGGKVEYFPFVHSSYSLVPPEKYFQSHPEYFALVDGARRPDDAQLCLTNPDVLRIAVARVREWIKEHPTASILSVSQNDSNGWCECDRCRRVEQEEGGQHSGPILRFVNAVAAEIEKTNPDKLIDTLAYWYSENPPAHVRPRPNVRIRLCPIGVCEAHPYEQCPRSAYFLRNLKTWAAITNQLYIWHYNTNFSHYLTPFPDFDELAADIPLYQRSGVVGIFFEGSYEAGGGGENAELRSYITARLLWNPRTDVERNLDEFFEGVYGPAAKPMRQYFDLLQREVRLPPRGLGQHMWIYNILAFSPGFLPEAHRLFDEALHAADSDGLRRRIEKARLPIEYVELLGSRQYLLDDASYAPHDLAGFQAHFRDFAARLGSFGILRITEDHDLKVNEANAAATRAYGAVHLDNESFHLALVPEMGGRIVRLSAKRAGREVPLLTQPTEGAYAAWEHYPDLAGQVAQAAADYPIYAWPATWKAVTAGPQEALLSGKCPNGLVMERHIRLDHDWVHTVVTARNATRTPLEAVVMMHAELDPGDIDAVRVRYRTVGGAVVDKQLLLPGEPPEGSETYKSSELPDGEWRLIRAGQREIVNRFPVELVDRVTLSWSAKGVARVTFAVWSKKRTLAAEEQLRLAADYR
jgi:hypothetical protein